MTVQKLNKIHTNSFNLKRGLRYSDNSGIVLRRMKKEIHPDNYRKVIFEDASSGERFLIGSTIETEEVGQWTDKKEYPLVKIEISSASHPFYTGKETVVDTAGRVDKFKRRMAAAKGKK